MNLNLKLMTFNIHKCIGGLDRKYRPDRVLETVAHYAPDVLLLQEVDDGVPRSRFDRQVDLLADELGFAHRAYQVNVQLRQGGYGNAILSRFAFEETHDVDLTLWPKKCRGAQIVKFRVTADGPAAGSHEHSRTVIVTNVHLGLAAFERKSQLRKLLSNTTLLHAHATTPTILAGDFNDVWQNLGAKSLGPNAFQSALGRVKTFPAAFPLRSLDGVYFRGQLRPTRVFAGHTDAARRASDHLPVVAEFQIGTSSPAPS